MKLPYEEVLKRLLPIVHEKYPHLTLAQVREITNATFKAFKEDTISGELNVYKYQWLGAFYIPLRTAQNNLDQLPGRVASGNLTQEAADYKAEIITRYINRKTNGESNAK